MILVYLTVRLDVILDVINDLATTERSSKEVLCLVPVSIIDINITQ